MIIREFYMTRKDDVNLYLTYSDKGFMVRQVGTDILYESAVDIEDALYTYEETNIPINGDMMSKPSIAPDEISAEELMALMEEVL